MIRVTFEHLLLISSWMIGWLLFARMKFLTEQNSRYTPFVSVIIPARNEEVNLSKLLALLKTQSYSNMEIIVVNDNSTDRTREFVLQHEGVRLIDLLDEPPKGWVGKSWACWNGYKSSKGQILIFMDADVEPDQNAIQTLVSLYHVKGGLLAVWPHQRFERFYEHLTLPFNLIVIASIGSFFIFNRRPIGAYGPVIVTSRENYERTKGHSAVRDGVLEDIKLGRLFLKHGLKVNNFLGGKVVRFRMYPLGIKQMFEGFTKNMSLGARSSGVHFFLLFFWIAGLYSAAVNLFNLKMFFYYFLFALQLFVVGRRTGDYTLLDTVFYPISYGFFLFVFFSSLFKAIFLRKVTWKGRKIDV
ncbi:glycosyltransferase [Pseudothermotoga sp. U03pept]|uniref:glycosyltransferase n=1 Tax=Pseudothermotoga sp. U03pept TaxID=3447012 RepID=UPI003F08CC36